MESGQVWAGLSRSELYAVLGVAWSATLLCELYEALLCVEDCRVLSVKSSGEAGRSAIPEGSNF